MKDEIEKPRLIAFEVTRRCRFNCLHCRANAGNTNDELTTGQCKKILASIAKFNKCVIILTGGEPMERSDIYELIQYGRKLGLRMVLASCGYLIDRQILTGLKKAGIMALSFSIDGAGAETHDEFTPGLSFTIVQVVPLSSDRHRALLTRLFELRKLPAKTVCVFR